jgi:hypothetical protein
MQVWPPRPPSQSSPGSTEPSPHAGPGPLLPFEVDPSLVLGSVVPGSVVLAVEVDPPVEPSPPAVVSSTLADESPDPPLVDVTPLVVPLSSPPVVPSAEAVPPALMKLPIGGSSEHAIESAKVDESAQRPNMRRL